MIILDEKNNEKRDFFFEMQKYAMHLRTDFVARQIAITELYRKTIDLPGSVLELGVRNGATFFFLARLMEIFGPKGRTAPVVSDRHLYGFDTFAGFPEISEKDQSQGQWRDMKKGGVATFNKDQFFRDLDIFRSQSPEGDRIHIIQGDVCETIPEFVQSHPGLVVAMLYLDLDLYQPTLDTLEQLYKKVVPGGIIVFDEFGYNEFPGETRAVLEFFNGMNCEIRRFPWAYCPSGYMIKQTMG
ncbi:MAG: class I SAM-dependent methyltransferase [Desulfobacter sp.]|nr:MAG: class I SAM-dependent methyltransferase [Desulfobacter sp.]